MRRFFLAVGITSDVLHPISKVDCPIISYYQPPHSPPPDVCRFALQGPFHGSNKFVYIGKELMNIIFAISTTN
jgi:hypothetical protein